MDDSGSFARHQHALSDASFVSDLIREFRAMPLDERANNHLRYSKTIAFLLPELTSNLQSEPTSEKTRLFLDLAEFVHAHFERPLARRFWCIRLESLMNYGSCGAVVGQRLKHCEALFFD